MTMPDIRPLRDEDWPAVWALMEPVVRAGDTYPYATDMDSAAARRMWIEATHVQYVAVGPAGEVLGTYYIKPNQPTLGAHVANCGYMVAADARGQGIGTALCEHSQAEAVRLGYRAMQFNLVVETNAASFELWRKLGFQCVGLLPGAFRHSERGYVGAWIMYKELLD